VDDRHQEKQAYPMHFSVVTHPALNRASINNDGSPDNYFGYGERQERRFSAFLTRGH